MAEYQANDNTTCVVCFKNVLYYSIGECDHPVCYECSTRMRVLCLQNECPICRQDLSRVVFTESIQPYKELRNKVFSDKLFERQYKIGYCTEEIKKAYESLLENCCKICDKIPPFRNFTALSDHMRKTHERFYCDLCVKNLRIFTSERRCYTRQELAHHRRKGDVDDTSHRGHPLCEFCEERFMDADELYRHLRKEHLYCHLCDADGRNQYYATHQALAHHFRTDHYLCEEGECAGQHLTAVFRSEIDLKAHKASIHGRGLARAAARQARTLELQFNITPHPVAQRTPRSECVANAAVPAPPPPERAPAAANIDTGSVEQFPRLSAQAPAPLLLHGQAPRSTYKGGDGLARTDRNFPALDGVGGRAPAPAPAPSPSPSPSVAATILKNSKPTVSIQLHSQPTSASNFRLTQASGNRISITPQQKKINLSDDDFPSLGMGKDDHPSIGASSLQPSKVTMINSQEMQSLKSNHTSSHKKKPQLNSEAFPALSSASVPTAPPQWITVTKSKDKNKVKPEPPPQPREPAFNAVSDFPTLPINSTKTKTKKPSPAAPAVTESTKTNKKDRKKQNNNLKKEYALEISDVNGAYEPKYGRDSPPPPNNNNILYTNNIDTKIKTVESPPENTERRKNGDFSMRAKDYPPLHPGATPPAPPVVGGFAAAARPPPSDGRPPPCDGMTFTNSSGETFPAPIHAYIHPPDFENRNSALVTMFAHALGSEDALERFKVASRAFRDNIITADDFYRNCETVLGSSLDDVFPELVALLPDIAKQQELVVGRSSRRLMLVCPKCGQLVKTEDSIAHDTAHWPPLAPR